MDTRVISRSFIFHWDNKPAIQRYGLTVLAVLAAALATLSLPVIGERAVFLLFFFAIFQTAIWLGPDSGILATILSTAAVNGLVLLPAWISAPHTTLLLNAGFCGLSAMIIGTTSLYRRLIEALKESRHDMAQAQAIGRIGSWRLNTQRNELRWSDENHRIFGIPQGMPLTYETFLSTIHPDDREYVDRMWKASLRGGPYDIEHRIVVAGQVKWVRERAVLEFGKKGNLLGGFGTTQDITERKQAELALLESRQRYAGVVESAMDAIISIDDEQRIVLFNAAAEKLFGCSAHEAIGKPIERFIPQRFRQAHSGHLRNFALTGVTSRKMNALSPVTGLRANGEEFSIEASISQVVTGDKKIFTAILRDISERLRAELERQKFVSLADNSQEFIGMCDMNFIPFYANPAGMNLVGLDSLEQACRTPVEEFFFPEDRRFITEEFFPRVLREGKAEVEIRFRHFKSGAVLWMIYNVFYIKDYYGAPVGLATVSRDITARKLAETALRESEEWLQQAKHAAGVGIYDHDLASGVMRWDERVRELWEVAPDQTVTLSTFMSGLHAEDRQLIKAEMVRACNARGNGEYFAEARVISRSGKQQKWVAIYGKVSFDAGRPVRFVGIIQDISARKAVEQSLVKSERRSRFLADILENADQPFAVGYSDGKVGYANRAFERLTGYSLEELTTLNWMETLTPAEWRISDQAKLGKLRHDRLPVRYQKDLLRKDGKIVPIELLVGVMNDSDSARGRYYAFITDLTERRATQAALRENEARLKLAFEAANMGLWDHDLITGAVYFSPEWKRQIGYNEDELPNRREEWENRLHPDERKHVLAVTEDYIAGRVPEYLLEFRFRHKDGLYRWIYCRGMLLRGQDERPSRLIGINVDITDFKKSQNLHESRGRMEESSRFYIARQTAAAIAHELNQPLTAVTSYTDVALLMLQNGNPQPEKLLRVLESCSQQAHRAGQVTRQLATLLHKGETATEPVPLQTILHEASEIVRLEGNLGDYQITQQIAEDLPALKANRLQIEKVLVNLLHNSIDAMSACGLNSGTITVTAGIANIPGEAPMAQVTVCDEGKGVADAGLLKTMFQPFYTTKPTGLGLGLATSRALIEAHGGKMWAEQNPGECLSINFTLPLAI